jgi:5-enolpyruvylshikimate-3-phosphate synthase
MAAVLLSYGFDKRVAIDAEHSVSKSYPNLFVDLKNCGAEIIE